MGIVITMGNFKGGAGKTTNAVMIGHALARAGRKVLILDMDPQGNATRILLSTEKVEKEKVESIEGYMLDALETTSFKPFIRKVSDKISDELALDYIPNNAKFTMLDELMEEVVPGAKKEVYEERLQYFKRFVDDVRNEYDYIFIDVPPTISLYTDAGLYVSDFMLFSLQTQTLSLDGAVSMLDYLKTFVRKYRLPLEVLGVLCVITNQKSRIEQQVIKQATNYFNEENMFEQQVNYMERLKRYPSEGIYAADMWDTAVYKTYDELAKELEMRLAEFGVTV